MRIIGGNFKGKKISLPGDKNTRPLRDLVKESIFNIINHTYQNDLTINGSNVLDLSNQKWIGIKFMKKGLPIVSRFNLD